MAEVAAPAVSTESATTSTETATSAAPATPPAAKPAEPSVPQMLKLKGKVGDQEVEEEIPYEKLHAQWQKFKAADKRLQEGTELQRRVQASLDKIKSNPFDPALKEVLGVDLRTLTAKQLMEEFDAQQLKAQDPKEFERQQLQRELEAERAKTKTFEEQRKQEQFQQTVKQAENEIIETYSSALQKSGLPVTEETFLRMAQIGDYALAHGVVLSAEQLATETKEFFEGYDKRAEERVKSKRSTLRGEDLIKELGEDLVKDIQSTLLARARAKLNRPAPVQEQKPVAEKQGEKKEWESDAQIMKRLGIAGGF